MQEADPFAALAGDQPGSHPASATLPGFVVDEAEVRRLGFQPHELRFHPTEIALPGGKGCEWSTLGVIPEGPGLYLFTITEGDVTAVAYVGQTKHLWMMTKGYLPRGGGARPGNRYGKPRYAGSTRQRVNILVAQQVAAGRLVRHWLKPTPLERLDAEEESFIALWRLRLVGWNVG